MIARRSSLVLGVLGVVSFLAGGCGGGGGSGPGAAGPGADLLVLAATPTNGQETLATLADPGLGGRFTARFTDIPSRSTVIDETNGFNSLTPNIQILDQNFGRMAGTPSLGPSPDGLDPTRRYFTFTPQGGSLPNAQYTVTISRNVSSTSGKRLNQGLEDFSTSWTVGPDVYPPVVRNTSPATLQSEVAPFAPVVVTFNESLEGTTVVLGQTVIVEDGGTNPPSPVNGTLALARDGFDMVFNPDPCVGLPPSTTVVVRLLGVGNTSFIRDKVSNGMLGNVNVGTPTAPVWEYQFQFNTKGVKPLPDPSTVPVPGLTRRGGGGTSPNILQGGNQGNAFYAVTADRVHAFDTEPVYAAFASSAFSVVNPSLTQQVLRFNADGSPRLNAFGIPYGGDWETPRLGGPADAVLDYRVDAASLHTYLYVVEGASNSVAIVNTGTGKVEGRFKGVGTPKGIGISGAGGLAATLWVSNFGQGTVTGIPLGSFTPGLPICTAVQELSDDLSNRVFVNVGRNPAGVAGSFDGANLVAVVNQGESEVEIFDPTTLDTVGGGNPGGGLQRTFPVGESPREVVWTPNVPGTGRFLWTTNQGGPNSPHGSVSLWWSGAGGFLFTTNTGSVLGTFEDRVNIPGKPVQEFSTLNTYIPNSGGDDVIRASITTTGNFFFVQIVPTITGSREVGPNPTGVTLVSGDFSVLARLGVASLAGAGQVAVWDNSSTVTPPALLNLPGVRLVFSEMDQ